MTPADIRLLIGDLYREMNTGDDDRAQGWICGMDVRVRTVVHPTQRHRTIQLCEYKASWEVRWIRTHPARLAEYLWQLKDMHGYPRPREARG